MIFVRQEVGVRRRSLQVSQDIGMFRGRLIVSPVDKRMREVGKLTGSQDASRSSYSCCVFSYSPRRYL